MLTPLRTLLLALLAAVAPHLSAQEADGRTPLGAGGGYWGAGLNGVLSAGTGTALDQGDTALAFLEGGWDFSPATEAFVDLGMIRSRSRTEGVTESTGFKPYLGAGIRGMLVQREPLTLTLALNGDAYANFTRSAVTVERRVATVTTEMQRHPWDASLLLALQRQAGPWAFYGGPLVYSYQADLETTVTSGGVSRTTVASLSETDAGGFAGIRRDLSGGWFVSLEGGYRGGAFAGAGLLFLH